MRPWWLRAEWIAAAAAAVTFLNVLPNDYCYDDVLIVRDNSLVQGDTGWRDIWTGDYWSAPETQPTHRDLLYRPLTLTSFRLVRLSFGTGPFWQHLVNVILHALICVLIVRLCRRVGGSEAAAMAAGLGFAVLPIHADVVSSVVGRADLLATMGTVAALLLHRRALSARGRAAATGWYATSSAAAFAAMCAKESGLAVLPLALLFELYWSARPEVTVAGRDRSWWASASRLLYVALPLGIYVAARYYALDARLYQQAPLTKTINLLVDAPAWQHALGVIQLWGMYWAKTLWPAVLSIKYSINSIHLATGIANVHVMVGLAATLLLVGGSLLAWRKGRPEWALLSGAILVSYLPTANLFVLMRVFFAERIWYLPSVWLCMLAGLALTPLLRSRGAQASLVVIALAMAGRCWIRAGQWRDEGTLYAAAVRDQPNAVGPLQLFGHWLIETGEPERAVGLLSRAVEIDLGYTPAHRDLGRACLELEDYERALTHLQIAEMHVPGDPATVAALDQARGALAGRGHHRLETLKRQAAERPGEVAAELAVVRALRDQGRIEEARARFEAREKALSRDPAWQAEYAITLVYLNEIDGAVGHYQCSVELDPSNPQPMVELAMLLRERGREGDLERAWEWSDRALELAPDAPSVLVCRAELHAARGEVREAIALYERALSLLPAHSPQRAIYEQRARALGR